MVTAKYEKGKLYDISIIDLKPDPNQPRKSMDPVALEELTASIKTHGVIQPILFRTAADSPYLIIVAGERRYKEIGGHDAASCPPISPARRPRDLRGGQPLRNRAGRKPWEK